MVAGWEFICGGFNCRCIIDEDDVGGGGGVWPCCTIDLDDVLVGGELRCS